MERRMIPLPPLVLATLGLLGALALVKLIAKERKRVNAELEQARARARAETEPHPSLRRDQDGVYRP
jgi:hypothetical protein